jgi:hypothetical protein
VGGEVWMNAVELSVFLGASYRTVLSLLQSGEIEATKNKNKWLIAENVASKFKEQNTKAIELLKTEFVSLYWQGVPVESLQKRVGEEFNSRQIIEEKGSFAEKTTYESIMKNQVRN